MRRSALAAGTYYGRPEERRSVGALRLCRTAYAARERIPPHLHESAYLCLALAGSFRERSAQSEQEVVAGSVVLHRAGETHDDLFGPEDASCLNVSFAPNWAERAGAWLAGEGPAHYAPPPAVGALARRLALEFDQRDEASELALEGLALELLAFFARDERRSEHRPPHWLRGTVERLRQEERVSLAELAGEASVHPATLARTFRRFHGCSPGEYRRRWRVEQALVALRTSDTPLSEIAARCGFADQSHLTRALRAAVGLAPAAYRRATRGT